MFGGFPPNALHLVHGPVHFTVGMVRQPRIVQSQIKVKLKGQLNVTVGGTDTTVDLYQEQTTTVNTSDKSFIPSAAGATTPITPPAGGDKK